MLSLSRAADYAAGLIALAICGYGWARGAAKSLRRRSPDGRGSQAPKESRAPGHSAASQDSSVWN